MAATLLDHDNLPDWMFRIKSSELIQNGEKNQQILLELSLPFPLANRKLAIENQVSYDPIENSYLVKTHSVDGYVQDAPTFNNVVGYWKFTQISENEVSIEHASKSPMEGLPNWLIKTFLLEGPFQNITRIIRQSQQMPEMDEKRVLFSE